MIKKVLIKFCPKSNLYNFMYLHDSHISFEAIILCNVVARRRHTGTNFGFFLLKGAERSSDEKLFTNSKKATKVYNGKQN